MFIKQRPPEGSSPGTLAIRPNALAPRITLIDCSSAGVSESKITEIDDLKNYRQEKTLTWIDIQGLGDKQLPSAESCFCIFDTAAGSEDKTNKPAGARADILKLKNFWCALASGRNNDQIFQHRFSAKKLHSGKIT